MNTYIVKLKAKREVAKRTTEFIFEKPADFKKWNDERPNVFFKWSLAFCDICRRDREKEALKRLPEVIKCEGKLPIILRV